jgi:hypothetical protein
MNGIRPHIALQSALRRLQIMLPLLVLLFCTGRANAQRTYAITASSGGGAGVATNITNAQGASSTLPPGGSTPATISATGNGTTGWMALQFGAAVPAGTAVYVKMANVSVGGGGSSLVVQAYNGTTLAAGSSSISALASDGTTTYYRVTATGTFDRVRITATGGLVLVVPQTASANIYFAFYEPTGTGCGQGIFTNTSITGIAVATIINPTNAIDGNLSTSSDFSITLGLVSATLEQSVYYPSLSNSGDAATVTLSVPPAVLTLGLFNSTTLTAYNGATQVGTPVSLNNVISLDLLGLLGNGNPYSITIAPGGAFDRVVLTMTGGLAGLLNSMHFHEVQITPAKPVVSGPSSVCSGSTATLAGTAPASGNELRWYTAASGGSPLTPATATTFVTPALTVPTTYYAAMARVGCAAESERVPFKIAIDTLPSAPGVSGTISLCSGLATTLTVASPALNTEYKWYKQASGGTEFRTGNSYTTSALLADTTFYVGAVKTTTGCVSATRAIVAITVTNVPNTITANQAICSGVAPALFTSILPVAQGTYSFQWQKSTDSVAFTNITGATGLTFQDTSHLVQTTYYRRSATFNGCTSQSNVIRVTVNPLPGITFNSNIPVCMGASPALLVYTATLNNPVTYSIAWSAPAVTAGFPAVTNAALPASPVNIVVPLTAAANSYTGTLTVKNGSNCVSAGYNITIIVQAPPHPPPPLTSYQ